MKKRSMAKLLAWLLASALALPLLPVSLPEALAADHTYYIDYGNITVVKNAGDASLLNVTYYASSGASSTTTDTVAAADELVIAQTNGRTGSIIAVASGEVHMTLDRVNIYNLFSTPFTISPGATVHLTISGACSLDAGAASLLICGMNVPSGAAVVIDKKTSDTSDSLFVVSGSACAGIGGGYGQSCGSVTINGGTVNATSGTGAGIGGGVDGSGGSVTINGGTVNATSGSGAGIGGGYRGSGGTVTINGGTVTAKSTNGGAGIGGGYNGNGGSVTITGGTVIATGSPDMMSGKYPASIGGGANAATHGTLVIDIPEPDAVIDSGYGGSITGSGPYSVTASSGYVIDSLKVDGTIVPDATGQDSYEIISVSKSLIVTFAYTANFKKPANGSLTVSSAGETITSGQIIRGGQKLVITAVPDADYVLESLTVNGEHVTDEYASGYTYTIGTKGYYRTLTALKDTGTQGAQIAASFVLASSLDDILVSVTTPDAITGVLNGTAKTAAALGLPATVTLVTDHGSAQANVTWDAASCTYDPGNTAAQLFTVNGTVTLPTGVQNPNSVVLATSVSVSVDAAQPSGTPPLITTSTLENGTVGLPYSQTLSAAGDTPVTWTVETGSLPSGLALSAGTIAGTPLAAGTFAFTVKAQNSAGSDIKEQSITVGPASYTVAASAELGGSITPGGTVVVAAGSSQSFTIVPDEGFAVTSVTVDNIDQGPINEYTFTGVDKDHTIHASFTSLGDDMAYGLRETEVSSTVISAEGLFKPSAKLNAIPLDGSSREDLETRLSGKDVIAAFEITIDPEGAYKPPLNVSFEIGDMYNGRTVYILHRLHSGEVEQYTPVVSNGEVSITVQELSPFLLAADPWIVIETQPRDTAVTKGQTATFSVSAQGLSPLSYQWQKKTRSNAAWADIPGAAGPEYTTSQTTLLNSGFQYRVIITDGLGNSVVSDAAALTVIMPPDTGDRAQPALYTVLMILFLTFAVVLLRRRKTV